MTKEEALKVLDTIPTIGEQVDALEMAIKALEQEPCDDAISREEALKHSHIEFDDDGEGHRVVYVEEIEDLPPVTPQRDKSVLERVEDCISRQALRQKLREHHDFFVNAYGGFNNLSLNDKFRVDEITNCIAMVVNAPSVTPQPKIGEWLEKEVNSDKVIEEWQSAKCSVCDKYHTTPYMYYFDDYKFCPNCGAKMEVET